MRWFHNLFEMLVPTRNGDTTAETGALHVTDSIDINSNVRLTESTFGSYVDRNGKKNSVIAYTWTNAKKLSIQVITYGARISSVTMPDSEGTVDRIIVGYDELQPYMSLENHLYGSTIGRIGGKVKNGKLNVGPLVYKLDANAGKHHEDGGYRGFDRSNWDAFVRGNKVILSTSSGDGESGYPGTVLVNSTFELNDYNEFIITTKATTTKPTVLSPCNNIYWNLGGIFGGVNEMGRHVFSVRADKRIEMDIEGFPTGKLISISDTVQDLQCPVMLGDLMKTDKNLKLDSYYSIYPDLKSDKQPVVRVYHPTNGRALEVYSTLPILRLHSLNKLPVEMNPKNTKPTTSVCFAAIPQNYPIDFSTDLNTGVLYPGDLYTHKSTYKLMCRHRMVTWDLQYSQPFT